MESTIFNLADIVTLDMLGGVLDQVTGVLPVVIPTLVVFIGIRKGISFVMGALRKA